MAEGIGYEDAISEFKNEPRRTYGSNFIFADRGDGRNGVPGGCAIEVTRSMFASFLDNDPAENLALWNGQKYAIQVPDAVFLGGKLRLELRQRCWVNFLLHRAGYYM